MPTCWFNIACTNTFYIFTSYCYYRSAVELYRYIDWFLTSSESHQMATESSMVPLSDTVAALVLQLLQERFLCRGLSVYQLVRTQLEEENRPAQPWRTPVFVATAMLCLLLTIVIVIATLRSWKVGTVQYYRDVTWGSFRFEASTIRLIVKQLVM